MNETLKINIDNYSGPLEVLLDLAKSQKVDLNEISITQLADQFIQFINDAKQINLDLASEYLLMATWLAYLKSKLLLPQDDEDDFKTFKKCQSFFAMTCHAIYSQYDSKNVATHSKLIISQIIRKHIKFKGLLISDDISMKSLKHKLEINALKAISAGCNLVLHCNGNINEMIRLSKVIPKIDNFTQKKTSQFYKFLR